MFFQLEICAFTLGSALTAQGKGAHRIELCDNPYEGGTTPSYGLIRSVREKLDIEIYPIIRPRGGDFLYSEEAYAVMRKDISVCKMLGCNGVVIGMLTENGTVDKNRCASLVDLAYPLGVTFHRAFDRSREPMQAMEDIIAIGCERILTSGQRPGVMEGIALIKQLIQEAGERIIIMPGAGLRADNVKELATGTGAVEFHTTAKKTTASKMTFCNSNMHEQLTHTEVDGDEVKRIVDILTAL
jgi:copper homeostasis protein